MTSIVGLTNTAELADGTRDTTRTGIRERHIAADGETTSDIGLAAARVALERAGMDPAEIDLIVLATSTPDNTFPASAVTIQSKLGITQGAAFALQAVCSGFVFALATADNFLRSGQFERALVIGAESSRNLFRIDLVASSTFAVVTSLWIFHP